MGQHELSNVSDANQPQYKAEASSHVHADTTFSSVGDTSSNQAWSKMTGAAGGGADSQAMPPGGGAVDGGKGGGHGIYFGNHQDIYGGSVSDSNHSGMLAGADSGMAKGGVGADVGGDSPTGAHSPMSGRADLGGDRPTAADASMASPKDGSQSASDRVAQSGLDSPSNRHEATLKNLESNRQAYDSKSSVLDGSKFQDLSDQQYNSLPHSELSQVNLNNAINIENRFADLGDKAPNFALRGGGDPQTQDLAAGKTPTYDKYGRHFAMAQGLPADPATRVSDFAANVNYAQGYNYQGGAQLHAFDAKSPQDSVYQKDSYQYSQSPFYPSKNAGEAALSPTPDRFQHVGSYNFSALKHNPPDAPVGNITPEHSTQLRNANNLKAMDRILSDHEKQNVGHLNSRSEVNEQRRAEHPPAQQMEARPGIVEHRNQEIEKAAAEKKQFFEDFDRRRLAQIAEREATQRAASEQQAASNQPGPEASTWSKMSNALKNWW
ncbi:MAG: hypothetical protein KGS72_01285 [Cyanobacteria bacterium REEB67]|nr:hypothetical protein [Cyanobacteria bacterium REEB67]